MMIRRANKTASALLILSALPGCSFFDSEMLTACEASLKKRLRSPSEYERIEIHRSEEKLDRNAFSKHLASINSTTYSSTMRRFDSGDLSPTQFTLIISYDAPNAYGTPIRGIVQCEYVDIGGDESRAHEVTVEIDGQTYTDWLTDAIMAEAASSAAD
ncbi:hypothetical protein [Sinorhizobium sp. BJ1]|uniref:hypothetical protein n=1 Tax=Sinorhizobium sp. BJ1 TaxID=2035455 RepID=UPI000BE98F71|nr:hypothetical protein [Sinorhizobium sp. BJ1]PDT80063.1 hypothetical protein CO676_29900 [Sinorhizobium sp. BJ1]